MSWVTLRPQMKTLLEANSKLATVTGTPQLKFGSYPSAVVIPSDQESDYDTTTENMRTYAFRVRVIHETKDSGIAEAMETIEEVLDELLDTFDQEDIKPASTRTLAINLPSGYTYIRIMANPSNWGEIPDENLMFAEIVVQIILNIDIT